MIAVLVNDSSLGERLSNGDKEFPRGFNLSPEVAFARIFLKLGQRKEINCLIAILAKVKLPVSGNLTKKARATARVGVVISSQKRPRR